MRAIVKSHRISYVIYPFDVLISFHKDYLSLEKELKILLPEDVYDEISRMDCDCNGRTMIFSSGQTCVWLREISHKNISHEVFHAVEFLMERIGMKLTYDSDEAYAYLIGYLTDEIYKVIK